MASAQEILKALGLTEDDLNILVAMPQEERVKAIAKVKRTVTKVTGDKQKTVLGEHRESVAKAMGETLQLVATERKFDIATVLPLNVRFSLDENGALAVNVGGAGRKSSGTGGTRAPSFIKAHGIVAIRGSNGVALERTSLHGVFESMLGVAGAKKVVGGASATVTARKPEHVKAIRDAGFTVDYDNGGTGIILADLLGAN